MGADRDAAPEAAPANVNGWQFACLVAVLIALVAIVVVVLTKFDSEKETATGVLGVVVPALVSIGAAVFGVKLAYDAGRSSGERTGEARGAAGKAEAVRAAQRDVASRVLGELESAGRSLASIIEPVRRAGSSPSGSDAVRLAVDQQAEDVLIPIEHLAGAPRDLAAAKATCAAYIEA